MIGRTILFLRTPSFLRKIIMFLIAGGTAAVFQLFVYIVLSRFFDLQYLVASSIAFALAVVVSFLLQKYVTFQDGEQKTIKKQFVLFLSLQIFNLGLNGFGMYILVDKVGAFDVLAQAITMGCIAVWSFVIYQFVIFSQKEKETNLEQVSMSERI